MKTAHSFARELLAGPDLEIFHFDPSQAGTDEDHDTSVSEPKICQVDPEPAEKPYPSFLTICGQGTDEDEARSTIEIDLKAENEKLHKQIIEARPPSPQFGYCPVCGTAGHSREPGANGNDRCASGHDYPSRTALHAPLPAGADPLPTTDTALRIENEKLRKANLEQKTLIADQQIKLAENQRVIAGKDQAIHQLGLAQREKVQPLKT